MARDSEEASMGMAGTFHSDSYTLTVAALTDNGNVRDHNEDAYAVLPDRGLLIVSDGMGGHNAGDVASRLVADLLPQMIGDLLSAVPAGEEVDHQSVITDTVVSLSHEMWERSKGRPGISGMGATVALMLFVGPRAFVAHMGDSRAYRYRDGLLAALTEDHSVVGILIRSGEISEDEASHHPARGMLSRYVGMEDEVYPDVVEIDLLPGDRFLLCTDGLTGDLPDDSIAKTLQEAHDLETGCAALIGEAKKGQARDNITVVLAEWAGNEGEAGELELVEDDSDKPGDS